MCKFFVVHNGSPAVLGMQDIDKLGLISVNYNTTHRQMVKDDSVDNSESPRATEGEDVSNSKVTSRKQKYKAHKMQTIHPSHLLSLIQWTWVKITKIMS